MNKKSIISEYFKKLGRKKSDKKAMASRENGKLGGRPKKNKIKLAES